MKATILLGTLKTSGISNTEVLCDFFCHFLKKENISSSIIRLVDHTILPGTYSDMGKGDEWPAILQTLEDSDIIIIATPIWWNNMSSEIQRVIERLDELHDEIISGEEPRFIGKVGGIIVTGDSDGAQSIFSSIANFFSFIGITVPPFAALTVLTEKHAKGKSPTRKMLTEFYEKSYKDTAEKMVEQLVIYSKFLNSDKKGKRGS